ncbi:PEP-CTERM sorting domain-containing protein [Gloeothece verrucosa]|uniref:Phytase-like domain-containing protein n=1 Tax=Gloeothece verrucosa (strain PCC 7822) TaxID=497965 RepID=E0ULH6_GLOV7|nr:PEP-CTERM sorting domain-containing protein [Gloeothece verrucosa]ADN17806.1 protein of unknown function DUF1555 [Gloeothece verrucosa PCC 7822]
MLSSKKFLLSSLFLTPSLLVLSAFSSSASAVELVGRAVLNADTFAPGPTSGQLITASNGRIPPFINQQPIQGFSAVLPGPKEGTYLVMVDNGFGSKPTSPDSLLRFYAVEPDFTTGQVFPVNLQTGERLNSFSQESWFQLNDQNHQAGFPIVADQTNYPGSNIPVDSNLKSNRWLTGADFDIESFRKVSDGTYWFGDEFGPFLLHVSANGTLLEKPISLPNFLGLGNNSLVQSPSNPNTTTPNLPNSKGFEGMALNTNGTKLYAMLEGPLNNDQNRNRLLINEFDLATKQYTGNVFAYRMENTVESGQAIGDLTAINDHEFLVIERDSKQGDPNNPAFTTPAQFKRIYKIDISQVDSQGFVKKNLLVDLLNIPDPNNLGGNGTTNGVFTFPFVTIEDVLIVDHQTLLVINDNNYPFSVGRTPGQPDNNEFILVKLDQPLTSVPEPSTVGGGILALVMGGFFRRKKQQSN